MVGSRTPPTGKHRQCVNNARSYNSSYLVSGHDVPPGLLISGLSKGAEHTPFTHGFLPLPPPSTPTFYCFLSPLSGAEVQTSRVLGSVSREENLDAPGGGSVVSLSPSSPVSCPAGLLGVRPPSPYLPFSLTLTYLTSSRRQQSIFYVESDKTPPSRSIPRSY